MVITRAHLGRLAVAVRFDGPTLLVLADHDAPVWMIIAAAILAKRDAEQGRRSA
jgi:hypothetical protein